MKEALVDLVNGLKTVLLAIGILAITVYFTKRETTYTCRTNCKDDGYVRSVVVDNVCWCMVEYEIDELSKTCESLFSCEPSDQSE